MLKNQVLGGGVFIKFPWAKSPERGWQLHHFIWSILRELTKEVCLGWLARLHGYPLCHVAGTKCNTGQGRMDGALQCGPPQRRGKCHRGLPQGRMEPAHTSMLWYTGDAHSDCLCFVPDLAGGSGSSQAAATSWNGLSSTFHPS